MAKGRKRKAVLREPNGQAQRPTAERLNELNRARSLQETEIVLAQPHRRGSSDKRCASALGRFMIAHGLRKEVEDAAIYYALLVHRWRAAKGIPTRIRLGEGGSGEGPSDATVISWGQQIARIELAMGAATYEGCLAARRLILDDEDIPSSLWKPAIIALGVLAEVSGRLVGHPYLYNSQTAA